MHDPDGPPTPTLSGQNLSDVRFQQGIHSGDLGRELTGMKHTYSRAGNSIDGYSDERCGMVLEILNKYFPLPK